MTALYIFLVILAALLLLFAVLAFNAVRAKQRGRRLAPQPDHYSEAELAQYAGRLAQMIRCETVSCRESFDDTEFKKLRDTVRALFPLLHEKAEFMTFGADCWVYKLPGKDQRRNMMVMSHHDVVAGTGEWKHPPFAAEIADGKLWGRGAVDTKTPLFAEFTAFEELLGEGFEPPCNLWLASSHNEEIGGDGIPLALEYFKKQGIEFELILDEGGAVIAAPMPGISCKCAMLAVHEKGRHLLKCTAGEGASHTGLAPKTDTPVVRMAKFIAEVSEKKPFIRRIYPQVRAMFEGLCPYMAFPMRLIFANLWLFAPLLKALMPKINPMAGAMLGTMCSFNTINGGKYGSVQAKTVEAGAYLRCIDDKDLAQDIAAFRAIAEKYGVEVTDGEGNEYHAPADLGKPAYAYVRECVANVFPHVACAPFILPAGTDARWLTDVCQCVVRFAPIDIDPQQFASVHSPDENIDIKAVGNAIAFYKRLLREYH
jgi:carboxypeptidase PM20D1